MIVCPWKEIGRYAAIIPGLEEALTVVFPEDAHAPGVHLDAPTEFTKLVIKLAL